ncbi:MAG: YaiI/YqxD family protein [Rhizobiaceae bacterium]|nr:YaiI/YqxD family protein [Rhizobiaceae bacterium]
MIYVDADACPVKEEVVRVAERHNTHVIMVADGGLRPSRHDLVRNHIVSQGADAADDWIAENITASDICVTSDIPLAKRCLEKGASAIRPNGKLFDEQNIGMALAMREVKQHIRESQQTQTYNVGFTKADRSAFLQALHALLV